MPTQADVRGGAARGGHLPPVGALEASWGRDLATSWTGVHSSCPTRPEWKPQPPLPCVPNSCPGPRPTRSHLSERETWPTQAQADPQRQTGIRLPGCEPNPSSATYLLCDRGQVTGPRYASISHLPRGVQENSVSELGKCSGGSLPLGRLAFPGGSRQHSVSVPR